jgi:fatty-acyl-CoA synthase
MASPLSASRRLVLPEVIGRAQRAHPDRAALVFGGETRSHAQLADRAARLAGALASAGIGRGDRVALLLHNGFEFVEALLACHLLGAVVVPVNFRLAPDEIRFILDHSGAVGFICDALPAELPAFRVLLEVGPPYEEAIAAAVPRKHPSPVEEGDAALMCYTSGTTGRPKGAVLTHRNLVASTLSWIHEMRAGEDDDGYPDSRSSTSAGSTGCSRF